VLDIYPNHLRERLDQVEDQIGKFPDAVLDFSGANPPVQEFRKMQDPIASYTTGKFDTIRFVLVKSEHNGLLI
jgi:hypothetical protein